MMVPLRVLSVFAAAFISLALLTPQQVCADVPINVISSSLFSRPWALAFDADNGTLLVANYNPPHYIIRLIPSTGAIVFFSNVGYSVTGVTVDSYSAGDVWLTMNSNLIVRLDRNFRPLASIPFAYASDVIVDSQYVYATCSTGQAVGIFTRTGTLVRTFTFAASNLYGIAMDLAGLLYIAGLQAAVKFASNGTVLGTFTATPIPPNVLVGIEVDAAGIVYSSDYENDRLVQWFPNGAVSHIYTASPPLASPLGLALQPVTGNIYTTSGNSIFVFAPAKIAGDGGITPSPPVSSIVSTQQQQQQE